MFKEIKQGVLFTLVTMVLLGGVYNVLLVGIGSVVFPAQAEGSLVRRADGTVIGSRLIGQKFSQARILPAAAVGGGLQRRLDRAAATTGRRTRITSRRSRNAWTRSWRRRRSPPVRCRRRW